MRSHLSGKWNKGATVVELMVVIAILAILTGGGYSMMGAVTGRSARQAESSLTSMLSRAKVTAMGQSKRVGATSAQADVYMEFFKRGDRLYARIAGGKDNSEVQLGRGDITIHAVKATGIDDVLVEANPDERADIPAVMMIDDAGTSGLRIAFSRKNGALLPLEIDSNNKNVYIKRLIIEQRHSDKKIWINITPATGEIWEEPVSE